MMAALTKEPLEHAQVRTLSVSLVSSSGSGGGYREPVVESGRQMFFLWASPFPYFNFLFATDKDC